jgi:hypothetical protein
MEAPKAVRNDRRVIRIIQEADAMKTLFLASAAMLLALSACGKNADSGQPITAEQVAKTIDSVKLQPGEWEAKQQIIDAKMTGLPPGAPADAMASMIGKVNTIRHCITPEQAANPSADFLAAQKDSKCTYANMDMTGGTIKADMSCAVPGQPKAKMTMTMSGTYGPDNYAMDMSMTSTGTPNGMGMAIKMKSAAKRVGDCPPGGDKAGG